MRLVNRTHLDTERLAGMVLPHVRGWRCGGLETWVRYSRGADFSGSCFYTKRRIYVNIGRHVVYPYAMQTHVARAKSNATHWWRDLYTIHLRSAYELALFVFLHEWYHWLIWRAGRRMRYREAMCDRFATRVLVDEYGCRLTDERGRSVPRAAWDFQDLEGFVARARRKRGSGVIVAGEGGEQQVAPAGPGRAARGAAAAKRERQGLLFEWGVEVRRG